MRIAVLSDTHIPIMAQDLPKEVYDGIAGCDMILHAGDIVDLCILDKLGKIAPVKAVCGNMDGGLGRSGLPKKDIIRIGSVTLGLIHGWGSPSGIKELVKREFKDKKVDAIIFGHSHAPLNEEKNGTLFFNPGSPTDRVFAPYNSYGILEIHDGKIAAEIIKIEARC